ncbi:MAG: dimethyladenosine transferase [Actinomycetota bacterium]|nr:MAG: dimethyladenosine transferase [Actinomycetota bacterium]
MAVCSSRVIPAVAKDIFDFLAIPALHSKFDGSGTVKGVLHGPERLYLSAKFGMRMKMLVPYRTTNTVIEFEENKLIAWRHFGGHIWRYRLNEISAEDGQSLTEVTECFDYSTARSVRFIQLIDAPVRNLISIEKTLLRLEQIFS